MGLGDEVEGKLRLGKVSLRAVRGAHRHQPKAWVSVGPF